MDEPIEALVTIWTFIHPSDLVVLRARLESEGIECFAKDELTVLAFPFSSQAVGGIKLQVRERDVAAAKEILADSGYSETPVTDPDFSSIWLDRYTSKIPFLDRLSLGFRLLLIITFFCMLAGTVVLIVMMPTTYERLTKGSWCLDELSYLNKVYPTRTIESVYLTFPGNCNEQILFDNNGAILLPGFRSASPRGQWALSDDSLIITSIDTFDFVYNGAYEIEFSGNVLVLTSVKTVLYAHSYRLPTFLSP